MKLKRRESPSLRVKELTDTLNKIKLRSTEVGGRGKILMGVEKGCSFPCLWWAQWDYGEISGGRWILGDRNKRASHPSYADSVHVPSWRKLVWFYWGSQHVSFCPVWPLCCSYYWFPGCENVILGQNLEKNGLNASLGSFSQLLKKVGFTFPSDLKIICW